MNKSHVKFGLFVIGLICAMVMAFVSFRLLTKFVGAFNEGADPASIFRGHVLVVPDEQQVVWVTTSPQQGELPSLAQLEEITAAYWLAWESLGRASLTSDLSDLKTYWAGSAYSQLLTGIQAEVRANFVTHNHKLYLDYFSDDGSVVVFRDTDFFVRRTIDDNTIRLQASAQIIMTLDQGFWRIRLLEIDYT